MDVIHGLSAEALKLWAGGGSVVGRDPQKVTAKRKDATAEERYVIVKAAP
mgnify:CR=1 FL=1